MAEVQDDWPAKPTGYSLLKPIGCGPFGTVYKAKVLEGKYKDKFAAVKKINLDNCNCNKIDELRKNILLLNLLEHPNILGYKMTFIAKSELWVIAELMDGGSIESILRCKYPSGIKDQTLVATILKETLMGISYLHKNNQIHRDIKCANILINSDGTLKISDFGLTTKFKNNKKKNTFAGSPCWMAPEVLNHGHIDGYDMKADIWSLGITALELAYGKPPNSDLTAMKLLLKIVNDEPPKLNKEVCWDEHFYKFISYCLVKEPSERKGADELLKLCKGFFSKAKDSAYLKEKLLKGVPDIESRFDNKIPSLDDLKMDKSGKSKSSIIDFNFELKEEEESSDSSTDLHPQLSRCHLSKKTVLEMIKKSYSMTSPIEEDACCNKENLYSSANIQKGGVLGMSEGQKVIMNGNKCMPNKMGRDNDFFFLCEDEV